MINLKTLYGFEYSYYDQDGWYKKLQSIANSGFPSEREKLSPFTKVFRGEEQFEI